MLIVVINPALLKVLWIMMGPLFWRQKRLKPRYYASMLLHVFILAEPLQNTTSLGRANSVNLFCTRLLHLQFHAEKSLCT